MRRKKMKPASKTEDGRNNEKKANAKQEVDACDSNDVTLSRVH